MAASKRELISPRGDKRFVRRDAMGRITESDDVGRSLAQDGRRAAKSAGKPGQGDKGDRKPAARKATASRTVAKKSASTSTRAKTASRTAPRKKAASDGRASAATRVPNAIQLLKADHVTVRGLLAKLEQTTSRGARTRVELLERIRREIEVHAAIEEEIFYPAFKVAGRKRDDDKMYFEAHEEHRAAGGLVLPDLLATDPASECFGGRAKVLKELIEHHAKEEEKEMFPRARALLSADELQRLGERMASRKQALLAQPVAPKTVVSKVLSAVVDAIAPTEA